MSMSWLEKARAALDTLLWLAQFTPTKIDDNLVAMLKAIIDIPAVQRLIDAIVNASLSSPEVTTHGLIANASPTLMADAEAAVAGKIGDGKLLELLEKLLPLILRFV